MWPISVSGFSLNFNEALFAYKLVLLLRFFPYANRNSHLKKPVKTRCPPLLFRFHQVFLVNNLANR